MTEGNDDGNSQVRVRAQVMMRDDSTGGWVPMGGGGLSNVSVRKRITQPDLDDPKYEYLIYGKRISDQTVVLSCTIKKDFEYNKVMPTFHHWKTGDMKFGLTFQTAADARAFDSGVRSAVQDLVDGLNDFPSYRHDLNLDAGDDKVFMTVNLPVERDGSRSSSGSVNTCSSSRHTPNPTPSTTPDHPLHYHHHHHHHHHHHYPGSGNGGGGVGSTGGTMVSTTNTSPSSTTSVTATSVAGTAGHQHPPHQHTNNYHHLYKITFPSHPRHPLPTNNNPPDKLSELECEHKPGSPLDITQDQEKTLISGESYSYVQFDRENQPTVLHHEYSYPVVEGIKGDRRDSIASIKKHQQQELVRGTPSQQIEPPLPPGKRPRRDQRPRKSIKAHCKYCQETFTYNANSRGSCEYAPDCVRSAINTLTCISCAQGMLYHCMSDAEGEFAHHPCECGGPGGTADESFGRRWLGLTLLSLLVPCLWCYLPLRACHRCAVACGVCGGRHEAS